MHFRCKLERSKTALKQIANIKKKEFLNLLSTLYKPSNIIYTSFIFNIQLSTVYINYNYRGERNHF